jgi:hypothetical protein
VILKFISDIQQFSEKAEPFIGVFGSKPWLSMYGKDLVMIGIYKDEHQMIGGFYYLKTKKLGFDFIKLPPYTPHCGLFFQSDSKNKSSANSFSKEVMQEVCNYFSSLKSALTILAFPVNVVDLQAFIWSKYKVIPNYTYQIRLEQSMEEIRANFDPKNRNAINKAIKEQVATAINGFSNTDILKFFTENLGATGANIYEGTLKKIMLEFANEGNSFCFSAIKNNELLGMVFCIYDKRACYYLLGGINKKAGIQGINNLLVQKSIERAKELNCQIFDFEGSMLKGVEKFFRSFGPDLFPYFTVNKASLPLELLLKFKKRELF